MTQEQTAALVEENMKTIFAYALSRVSHKEDAEDLAGDIVLAILQSSHRLRDDHAFFGYIWSIAANTYKKFLRRKSRSRWETLDEELADADDFTRDILKSAEFNILRRELSLLSREYRECTVAYYFQGLSCGETASRLGLSLDMVKYYLFKTRKILKEGIQMEREFGTKSYHPAKFKFCTIFSQHYNKEYQNLFSRKLPGNILVSAYYTPMTIRELAIELGVAAVYLEDEIALLERYQLLTALPGGKYQTRLIIFTEDYRNEFYKTAENSVSADIAGLISRIKEDLPALRALDFPGSTLEDNRLVWAFLFELVREGFNRFISDLGDEGAAPRIYGSATGISYGLSYEPSVTDEYDVPAFAGYWGLASDDSNYAGSYADFGILPRENHPSFHAGELVQNLEAVLAGSAHATVPILDREQKKTMTAVFRRDITELSSLHKKLYRCALSIMKTHAPGNAAPILNRVLANSLLSYSAGLISACAVKSGALAIPKDGSPLGIFLYKTE